MRRSDQLMLVVAIAAILLGFAILWQVVAPFLSLQKLLVLLGLLSLGGVALLRQQSGGKRMLHHGHAMPTLSRQSVTNQGITMHEMTRYFAWVEKKMNDLMVSEGLECGLVRIKRGPLVITMQLRLINPTQRDLQKLMKIGPALAQLLHVETVRIADTAQGVMVELPSPKPRTPNGALLARHTRGLVLPVGVDTAARPLLVNVEDHGALFWVGPSRRGKTQSMKSALYALLAENRGQIHFIIIASPAKVKRDWGLFRSVEGCLGIASNGEDITAATAWVVSEMNSPQSMGIDLHLLLVVDDLPNILKAVPHIKDDLADIASMGAGLGVHLLIGTQGAGSKRTSGGNEIENNVTARILYRPATSRTGSQNAGTGGLALYDLSSAKGDALALVDGHATRIATAWILDRDIALLPQQPVQRPPWQSQSRSNNRQNHLKQAKTAWKNREQPIEQPETKQNNHRTGQNQVEQPRTSPNNGFYPAHAPQNGQNELRASEQVPEQFLEQGAEQPVDELLQQLADCSIDELKAENLGFDAVRPPSIDEQCVIQHAFALTDSIRKTCFMVYGHYNGKVRDYVKSALAKSITNPDADAIPEHIDLTTSQGRAALKALQSNGHIHWPDPNSLLDDLENE